MLSIAELGLMIACQCQIPVDTSMQQASVDTLRYASRKAPPHIDGMVRPRQGAPRLRVVILLCEFQSFERRHGGVPISWLTLCLPSACSVPPPPPPPPRPFSNVTGEAQTGMGTYLDLAGSTRCPKRHIFQEILQTLAVAVLTDRRLTAAHCSPGVHQPGESAWRWWENG